MYKDSKSRDGGQTAGTELRTSSIISQCNCQKHGVTLHSCELTRCVCVCVCVWDYQLEGLELIYAGICAFFRQTVQDRAVGCVVERGRFSLTSCCTTCDTQTHCSHDVLREDECFGVVNGKWTFGSWLLFSVAADEKSLRLPLISVFVSLTWFSHRLKPPLCKTASSPTLWPVCEVTEQRWERCTFFLGLVFVVYLFSWQEFLTNYEQQESEPAAWRLCWTPSFQLDRWRDDVLIYIIKVTSVTCTQSCCSCLSWCPCFILTVCDHVSCGVFISSSCVHLHLSELPHLTCVISWSFSSRLVSSRLECVWFLLMWTLLCGF